jgi:glycosyltransferase involved in cell wall biosynthesis
MKLKESMQPLVSILVPVYDVEKYIERCARSLFTQTLKDHIEFIFINDCTKDNSIDILKKVLTDYPNRINQVKIINHDCNRGTAATRSTGINHATGEYIAYCDSDDWVESSMYEKMYEAGNNHNADIVSCNFKIEKYNKTIPVTCMYNDDRERFLKDVLSNNWGVMWKIIVKRKLLLDNKVILLEGINNGEDYIYTVQCLLASVKAVNLSECFYHYNCANSTSMMKTPSEESALQQKKATDFIVCLLEEKNISKRYANEILLRKYFTRNRFIRFGIKKWRRTYPEIMGKYWSRSVKMSFITKMQYALLEHFPHKILQYIIDKHYHE